MHATLESGAVLDKTVELCETLVNQPDFVALQRNVQAFLADDAAKRLYQTVVEKGEHLHHKQHEGVTLADAEIAEYDRHRQALMLNPVAKGFMEAQEQLQQIAEGVNKYIHKTLELGRVPGPEDFESCGSGCDCHH